MSQSKPNSSPAPASEINIREELEKYLRYWPWFLLCAAIALGYAYFTLRKTTPVYATTATLIIKDGKNSQSSEMAAFSELGLMGGMNSNSIENEIGIMRSRRLMATVVKALNINVQYFQEQKFRNPELYTKTPIFARLMSIDEIKLQESPGNEFRVNYSNGENINITRIADEKVFKGNLGHPIDLEFSQVIFEKNPLTSQVDLNGSEAILVKFSPVETIAGAYRKELSVMIKEKNSSLIELGLNDPVRSKAEDILDQLVLEYNREAIEDKNLVAINTAKFIDERLMIINGELDSVETGKVEFKEENQLTDIQGESQLFMSTASEFKGRQQEIGTQIELAEAMISYLKSSSSGELLPANLGIEESAVNQGINNYNELVLERNKVLSGSTEINPVVVKLNRQIDEIRGNILLSLNRMKSNLQIAEVNLNSQAASIRSQISSVPSKEKQFRGIERQQQIKETLFLFLLQKREENSLSLAVTAPKAKIVDTAFSSRLPISPIPRNLYLTALLIGLGLPFAFIYLKNLLNNKINSREDVESKMLDIPVVGEIPRIKKGEKDIIEYNDRSVLAESFRILHTNLQYLMVNAGNKAGANILFVTSSVKGEGKTFTAFNLALTLANSGKRVLIMGADLRNPQLQRYEVDTRDFKGISDFLVNSDLELKPLITTSGLHKGLSLLSTGSIPPNPSELWRSSRAELLFESLKKDYDYIVVDTAPVMLVTDTFLISKYADLTLYVTRAGYTEKKLLNFALDAKKDGKLHDVSFVLNDVKLANFGYGNKYGYSYGVEQQGFWEKLKAAF